MADNFDLDAYFNRMTAPTAAPVNPSAPAPLYDGPKNLTNAGPIKREELQQAAQNKIDALTVHQEQVTKEEAAKEKSWVRRLGLNEDGLTADVVNVAAQVTDTTVGLARGAVNMVPATNARILDVLPNEVKEARARQLAGEATDEDIALLNAPMGDRMANQPVSKYTAIARAKAAKTGTLETNQQRIEKIEEALKFSKDVREQMDVKDIVLRTNQDRIVRDLGEGYDDNKRILLNGWDRNDAGAVVSGLAGMITGIGSAAWDNPAASAEFVIGNIPQLALTATGPAGAFLSSVPYAMEEYSKGIDAYRKANDGKIPSQEELAVMAAKASTLALAEYAGDKLSLGVGKAIPGAVNKVAPGRLLTGATTGAAGEFVTEGYQTAVENDLQGKGFDDKDVYIGGAIGAITGGTMGSVTGGPAPSPAADASAPVPQAVKEAHKAAKESGDVSALTDPQNPAYAPDKAVQALMANAKKTGMVEAGEEGLSQAFEIVAKISDDYNAKLEAFEKLDKATPEAKALDRELKAQSVAVDRAQKVLDRFQKDYLDTLDVEDQIAQIRERSAAQEGGATADAAPADRSVENLITLSMVAPKKLKDEHVQALIDNPTTTETQREYLRQFSEARIKQNALVDMGKVSKMIVEGNQFNEGINDYRAKIGNALSTGNRKEAEFRAGLLDKFRASHESKAALVAQEYAEFEKTGVPVQVVRKKDSQDWEVRRSDFLTGNEANKYGAVTIDARSKNLSANIVTEAQAIAAAHAELRSAIALRFQGATHVPNQPQAQGQAVGQAPAGPKKPVSQVAKGAQAAPTVPAQSSAAVIADTRKTVAALERTRKEQAKRERLLGNADALAAYAAERGITVEEMRNLLQTNYDNNKETLRNLEATVASDTFKQRQQQEQKSAKKVSFKDLSDKPVEVADKPLAEMTDDELYAYGMVPANVNTPEKEAAFFAEMDRRDGTTVVNSATKEDSNTVGTTAAAAPQAVVPTVKVNSVNTQVNSVNPTGDSSQLHSTEKDTSDNPQKVPEAPSVTDSSTQVDQESATGLSALQGEKATISAEQPMGKLYSTINRARQFLKQTFSKGEKASQSKPLADINNFIRRWDQGEIDIQDMFDEQLDANNDEGKQAQALKTFLRFAKAWNGTVRQYMDPSKFKAINEKFRFEDPLQDFYNADGSLDENVTTAISYGAYSWVADTANSPATMQPEDILDMHGLHETDTLKQSGRERLRRVAATEDTVINDIGQRVIKALGIKDNAEAPVEYINQLASAFGAIALRVLEDQQRKENGKLVPQPLIQIETIPGADLMNWMPDLKWEATGTQQNGDPIYPSMTYVTLVRDADFKLPAQSAMIQAVTSGSGNIVDKLFDSEKAPSEASWKKIPFKQEYAKRTQQKITDEQRKIVEAQQAVPHRIIPAMWDALKVLGDEVILKAAGFNDNDNEKVHVANRDSVEAQNRNLRTQLDNLRNRVDDAVANSPEKMHQSFFLNFEVWRNFRVGIATRDLNPQSSKIHRFMLYRPEWKATLDKNNQQQMDNFLIAVAQNMGVKVDQQRNELTLGLFAKFAQKHNLVDLATRLNQAIESDGKIELSQQDKDAIAKLAAENEGMMTLQALVAYGKYLSATGEFTVHMLVGVDGKTNGPILSHLALGAGIDSNDLYSHLQRGGMYRESDGVSNYNVWYEGEDSLDLYEDLAEKVAGNLDMDSQAMRAIQVFTKALLTDTGKISSAGRKIVKTPLTAFAFGSAVEKSVASMEEAFIQSIYDKIQAVADGTENKVSTLQMVQALNDLFGKDELKLDEDTTIEELMDLNFEDIGNKKRLMALQSAFQSTLGDAVTKTMGTYFAVFEGRRQVVTSAVGASFAIYDALFRDLEKKEMNRLMDNGDIQFYTKNGERFPMHGMNRKQYDALRAQVAKVLPQAHTAYSLATGDLDAGLYMAKTAVSRSDKPYAYVKVQTGKQFKNGAGKLVQEIRAKTMQRREIAPGAAGLPYMMHSSDSAIMHRAVAQYVQAMNVHDEIGNGVDKITDTAKAINGATWSTLLAYSPMVQSYEMLQRSVKNVLDMANKGEVSPEVVRAIQTAFYRMLPPDQRKTTPKNKVVLEALSNMAAEVFEAERVRLGAMAEMTAIDQYTWQGGQYDVTQQDRDQAAKMLAAVEAQGVALPADIAAAASDLGKLFKATPSAKEEKAAKLKAATLKVTPTTAPQIVREVADRLGSKNAQAVAKAVAAGQNVAEAINAMPQGLDKDRLIQALVKAGNGLDKGIETPFGKLGTPAFVPDAGLQTFFEANPNPTAKDVIRQTMNILAGQKEWNSKLMADMLRVIYKLAPDDLKVNYITPDTPTDTVLEGATTGKHGWYTYQSSTGKHEVNFMSPAFTSSRLTPEVVTHELLHAVLARAIETELQKRKDDPTYESEALELVIDLENLLTAAQGFVADKKIEGYEHALSNVHELLSYGLTNWPFQQEVLSQMKKFSDTGNNRLVTAMKSFIDTIAKYLFKKPSTQQTNGLAILIANASGLFKHVAEQQNQKPNIGTTMLSMAAQKIIDYSTQDVFQALDDGFLDDAAKNRIEGLLDTIVAKVHGKNGSLRKEAMSSRAGNPLDVWLTNYQNGEFPFASKAMASGFFMTPQVAYALEQVEVSIKTVLDGQDAAAKQAYVELNKLFTQAYRQFQDPKHFFAGDWSLATPSEKDDATALRDFVFRIEKDSGDRSDYLARFAALALVHPQVNKLLQVPTDTVKMRGGSFAETVQGWFENALQLLSNKITGTYDGQRADIKLEKLVRQLVDIEFKHKTSLVKSRAAEMLEPVEETGRKLAQKGRETVSKLANSDMVKKSRNQFVRTAGVLANVYANDTVEEYIGAIKTIRNKEFKSSEGLAMSLLTEMKGHLTVFQQVLREAKKNEGERKDIITQDTQAVMQAFADQGAKLTNEQKAGLSQVFLRSGAHHLLAKYDLKQIEQLLTDPAKLEKEIKGLERSLSAYGSVMQDRVIEQARVLGYYKATGRVRGLLHANAYNISLLLGTKYQKNIDEEMAYRHQDAIAQLVSLYAMGYADSVDRAAAREVLATENGRGDKNGVEFMLKLHQYMEQESFEKLFKGNPTLMMHGYTPEVYNPNTTIQVVGIEEGKLLMKQGYVQGPVVPPDELHAPGGVMHIYVQKDGGLDRRVTGAFSLKDTGAKGTVLEIDNPKSFTNAAIKRWEDSTVGGDWKAVANRKKNQAAPIFNELGQITDWRYLMSETAKDTWLERNNDFAELIGRMGGSVYDKVATPVQNKRVVEVLREEYNQSFADNPDRFLSIGPGSADPELREIWALLPQQTKDDIRTVWGRDELVVPKDSVTILFGYRKLSLAALFDKEQRGHMEDLFVDIAKWSFGGKAQLRVRQFERAWAAIVSEVKDIIVVKTGTVLLGNIKSNMWLLAIAGVPIKSMINSHLVALRGATAYRRDSEKLAQLRLAREADYIKDMGVKELDDEITRLEDSIARNPVRELIDAGLMPSIVEDVALADDKYSYRSKFVRDVDAQMEKLPKGAQTALKQVYMAHDTKLYQGLSRVTQLSDFVARYALYQHLTTRQKNPLSKAEAIQQASEAFVNYDIPMHPLLQYLDDMGIIPFMKYFLRIQKVLLRLMRENPARVLGTVLLDNLMNVGETVLDSSILNRLGNNPLTSGAFRYFGVLDELATVSGPMALIK